MTNSVFPRSFAQGVLYGRGRAPVRQRGFSLTASPSAANRAAARLPLNRASSTLPQQGAAQVPLLLCEAEKVDLLLCLLLPWEPGRPHCLLPFPLLQKETSWNQKPLTLYSEVSPWEINGAYVKERMVSIASLKPISLLKNKPLK